MQMVVLFSQVPNCPDLTKLMSFVHKLRQSSDPTVSNLHVNFHYENMPMQYTKIFKVVKNEEFQQKFFDINLIFAQNIDCGFTLEPPRRGGSNEYPQSIFWSTNKKNRCTPANPRFSI